MVNEKIDLDEVQSNDPMEVTEKKAREAIRVLLEKSKATGKPAPKFALIEDTCLCFSALGGLPGPFIRFFLEKLGPDGLHRMLQGYDDKKATAVCTFAVMNLETCDIHMFQGRCEGSIVAPRGKNNFGWDPIFEPCSEHQKDPQHPLTYAEMPSEQKNGFSHRRRALDGLRSWVENHLDLFA